MNNLLVVCKCERESEREQARNCRVVIDIWDHCPWSQMTRGNGHPGDQGPRAPGAKELPGTQQRPLKPLIWKRSKPPRTTKGLHVAHFEAWTVTAVRHCFFFEVCISSWWCTFSFATLCLVVSVCRQTTGDGDQSNCKEAFGAASSLIPVSPNNIPAAFFPVDQRFLGGLRACATEA